MQTKTLPSFALTLILAACGAESSSDDGRSGSTGGATSTSGGSSSNDSGGASAIPGAPAATGGTRSAASGGAAAGVGGGMSPAGGVMSTIGGRASGVGGTASAGNGGAASGPPPPANGKPDASLVGFATHPALGLQTTTGGDGGSVVTVTTFEDLRKYAGAPEAYVVQVQGTISTADAKYAKVRVTSNKTIVGLGADATLEHIGLDVTGWWETEASALAEFCDAPYKAQFTAVSNVIVRNLNFKNTMGNSSDADGVVVQCYSHHVWIDHNTFHGLQSGNDGAIDVKRGADWITISWNHIKDWDKAMLLGHVDTNGEQDRGTLHVTYHHNYLQNTRQRHPRVRFAQAHLFNNLLYNDATVPNRTASYFLVAGVEANVHADGNLVQHAKEIYIVGEESDPGAKLTYTATNKAVALSAGAEAVFQIQPNGAAFDPKDFYDYTLQAADDLSTLVPQGAGAGKL